MEKAEAEKKREEQQNVMTDTPDEKEKLRLELERVETGSVASEASEGKNEETLVIDLAPAVEQQGNEEEEQIENNDLNQVSVAENA